MSHITLVRLRLGIVTILLLFLIAGCTPTASTISTTSTTPPEDTGADYLLTATAVVPVTSEPDPLTGTRWELVAFESREIVPTISDQPRPFIEFNQGLLALRNTCNGPGGHYLLENEQITITFAEMTAMDCSDELGSDIMEVESAFFATLPTFESFAIEGDQLRISYEDGEILFRRLSE